MSSFRREGPFSRGNNSIGAPSVTKNKKVLSVPIALKKKVNLGALNAKEELAEWIQKKIEAILNFDDEVLCSMILNLLEPNDDHDDGGGGPRWKDGTQIYVQLLPFLEDSTDVFMTELWTLISDLDDEGVPKKFNEDKERKQKEREAMAAKFRRDREDKNKRREDRRKRDRTRRRERERGFGGGLGGKRRDRSRDRQNPY